MINTNINKENIKMKCNMVESHKKVIEMDHLDKQIKVTILKIITIRKEDLSKGVNLKSFQTKEGQFKIIICLTMEID